MVMFQRSVLFFFLFAVGCGESNSPTTDSSFPATTPSARNSTSAGTGSLDANLAYWDGMNSVPRQMTQHMNEGPDAQIWALRKGATVIRQNPTLGIDTDLVAWALRFADLLEQRAILIEQSRNPCLDGRGVCARNERRSVRRRRRVEPSRAWLVSGDATAQPRMEPAPGHVDRPLWCAIPLTGSMHHPEPQQQPEHLCRAWRRT